MFFLDIWILKIGAYMLQYAVKILGEQRIFTLDRANPKRFSRVSFTQKCFHTCLENISE
jgi:hypothetical protein